MFKTHRTYELTNGVKNNTIAVIVRPKAIHVVYHKTIVLNTGGWNTISTRYVINRALEQSGLTVRVSAVKGTLMLGNKVFKDGMKISIKEVV